MKRNLLILCVLFGAYSATGQDDVIRKALVSIDSILSDNDKIELKITDNGSGISQHIVEKIFQPFFTTRPTGQGTGLGLSLAYDIITKGHAGELKVETKEGKGSTFTILLPSL